MVTQLCPGFIVDSAPHKVNGYNVARTGAVQATLLQLTGLSMGSGNMWIKTDSSDVLSLGYGINIHVSCDKISIVVCNCRHLYKVQ